jgi:DNA modification methylase
VLILADARAIPLASGSVQMVMTSPPYWGLRDYGVSDQIGLEPTPQAYVENIRTVFRELHRVLRDDGTVWLNLGDSYYNCSPVRKSSAEAFAPTWDRSNGRRVGGTRRYPDKDDGTGLKMKDLVGIPWRVAFALQADGWYLRSDIIWHKPNPMPESVRDRPTKAHEYLFLLTKSPRYYYDAEAIREAIKPTSGVNMRAPKLCAERIVRPWDNVTTKTYTEVKGANRRSVWTVPTAPYRGAHFATFPPALVTPTVRAGSRPGDLVLDPFVGSGTVGAVCEVEGRRFVGMDLNPEYLKLATARIEEARRKGKV